ncbi:hypothetical protein [Bartonella sp. AR 15-3]|uniref:hypothetical protein n=1 Tax=Bartonella sp. AR 15-3 TaxID=545617 RepID=UPI0001F4BA24|nr:hypothetical protein [Bartonella sp. AR 15-3]OPB32211.1 hypothetical protein BAR153v2_011930 [Bartonella sp. AR 15-3]CBI79864.1 conserved hypothetical protein [Bartonella sp. AR 15-3]
MTYSQKTNSTLTSTKKHKSSSPSLSISSLCPKKPIGHLKTREVIIETSNPSFQSTSPISTQNPRTTLALIDAHSRPIALLYKKGHINQAQYKAAERFYVYWRQCQGDTQMSLDLTAQKVDNSQRYIHPIEAQTNALKQLQTVKIHLGILGYRLVEQVVGYDQALKKLSPSKRKQNSLADHLRDCLDLLAVHWGYANRTSIS